MNIITFPKTAIRSTVLAAALATGLAGIAPVHAEVSSETKQEATFVSSALVGLAAGGPVGFMIGAAGGQWMAGNIEKADQLDVATAELDSSNAEINQLRQQLAEAQSRNEQYAQLALEQLQLEMLFKTASSELTAEGQKRVAMLADFLNNNPDIMIRVDGYADPRGDAQYNMALSQARADAVVDQLVNFAVNPDRITTYSHGDNLSTASEGDLDAYALERVVRIELSRGDNPESVAQINISQ